MKYERAGLLLEKPTQTPEDAETYESYQAVMDGAREFYKELTLPADKKADVLAAWQDGHDADLTAKHLDRAALADRLASLRQWKQELLADTSLNPTLKQAYRWAINERIANQYMLLASADGDMRQFRQWNEFVYGKPDEMIYRAALDWVANDADALLADDSRPQAVKDAARRVVDMLEGERGYRELLAPDDDTFRAVRESHTQEGGFYDQLYDGIDVPASGKVNNEVGDPILAHAMNVNLESDYTIADADGASWGMTHSLRAMERPEKYNMPWQRLIGLTSHELSHLLEKINGSRGPAALAEGGLDRVELGNEGRAMMREQVVYETFDQFGKLVRWRDVLRRHIAISYAYGVGEDQPRASHEVYDFMNAIDTMYQAKLTPDGPELTAQKARAKTGTLLTRVLKGTDGAGYAYLKDKVYLEGHVASWLTAAMRGPEAVNEGDLGKFDINNPRHIVVLQQMGLLPSGE